MSCSSLILASRSPRRSELLRQCNVDFSVEISPAEELDSAPDITALPMLNAALKAAAVADRNPAKWVLGADTMIVFENSAIGKPADLAEAARFLRRFSGKSHQVITGMALICRQKQVEELWSETSVVSFKNLSDETIREYLEKVDVLDKAGAYAIQEHGESIVEKFSGEIENIVGLPLINLRKLLNKYSIGDNGND
jgi:septum formation protein